MRDGHFTLVFPGDIRRQAGNPFHIDTPFGRPETVARGDVTAEFAALEEERDRLVAALAAARAEAEERGRRIAALESENGRLNRVIAKASSLNGVDHAIRLAVKLVARDDAARAGAAP